MARTVKPKRVERGLYIAGKTYLACATPPGTEKARWKTIGEVGLMEARKERDAWAVEVRAGGVAATGGRETVKQVGEAAIAHIERLVDIEELRPRTLESYKTGINLHLIPELGHRRARSITPEDLVEWHRKQRASKASEWSIRARWIAVRLVFAYAARHDIIAASPADKLLPRERPSAGEPRQRFLTREEMDKLLEHAGGESRLYRNRPVHGPARNGSPRPMVGRHRLQGRRDPRPLPAQSRRQARSVEDEGRAP